MAKYLATQGGKGWGGRKSNRKQRKRRKGRQMGTNHKNKRQLIYLIAHIMDCFDNIRHLGAGLVQFFTQSAYCNINHS